MTDAVKPIQACPFCGELPISFPSGDGSGLMIECVSGDCVHPHVSFIPPSAAIEAWNTRTPDLLSAVTVLRRLAEAADACAPQREDAPGDVQAAVNEAFALLARLDSLLSQEGGSDKSTG